LTGGVVDTGQDASPVSFTLFINLSPVSFTLLINNTEILPHVVDTGDNSITGVDTGGKFITGVNYLGGKFVAGVNNTGDEYTVHK